ncbi:hypothetical protein C5748_14650 [Phyllobacterium phragmitis]|uniref:Flagellar hook-length control protein-like C-terminal domain-containing protein n=1 Tax=Phyllobacterium phragmitis TaxID=2670329 RepID=A0A2S9IQ57_9HYPH|nr:flagellar hook-length control protein FliK [Phyllobacterium phragmitis]PRD42664.1 hypothetical protein C5748_14650 [Phyllobacterium phragmitis]
MTIKDALAQAVYPSARATHAQALRSKSAPFSVGEDAADMKSAAANFETLVKEFGESGGKAEKRSSRTSNAEDPDAEQEKDNAMPAAKEPGSIATMTAQAMLAFDPLRIKQAETASAAGSKAGGSGADTEEIGKQGAGLSSIFAETQFDENGNMEVDGPKTDGNAPKQTIPPADPAATRQKLDRPASDVIAKPNADNTTPVANDGKSSLSAGGGEIRNQETTDNDPKTSTQPDVNGTAKPRSSDAPNAGAVLPNTQSRAAGASNPAGSTNVAAPSTRPAIHIAEVQIVSERSYGVAKVLNIRLEPIELGTVTARLRLVPNGMQVELVADRRETAERLSADRDLLGKALQSAGLSDHAVVAITVTERGGTSTANATGGQTGQQNFAAQDQSGGRNGGQPHTHMQGEGNGNRDQRGAWTPDEQAQGSAPPSPADARGDRRLSRDIIV